MVKTRGLSYYSPSKKSIWRSCLHRTTCPCRLPSSQQLGPNTHQLFRPQQFTFLPSCKSGLGVAKIWVPYPKIRPPSELQRTPPSRNPDDGDSLLGSLRRGRKRGLAAVALKRWKQEMTCYASEADPRSYRER